MGIGSSPIYVTCYLFVTLSIYQIRHNTKLATCYEWLLDSQSSPALGIEPSWHLARWDIKHIPKPKPLHSFLTAPLVHLRCSLRLMIELYHKIIHLSTLNSIFFKNFSTYKQLIIPKRFHLVQNFKKRWACFNTIHLIKIPTK